MHRLIQYHPVYLISLFYRESKNCCHRLQLGVIEFKNRTLFKIFYLLHDKGHWGLWISYHRYTSPLGSAQLVCTMHVHVEYSCLWVNGLHWLSTKLGYEMLQCIEYDSFFSIHIPRGLTPDIPHSMKYCLYSQRKKNLLSIDLEVEEWVTPQQLFYIVKPSISPGIYGLC